MNAIEIVNRLGNLDLKDFTKATGIPVNPQLIPLNHPNRPKALLSKFQSLGIHYTANENIGAHDINTAKYFGRSYKANPADPNSPFEEDGKKLFAYGSTQMIFDMDSGTQALPLNNVGWGAGDRALPYTDEFKGQQKIAKYVFNNSQNYRMLNIEVCNNKALPDGKAWELGLENTKKFVIWLINSLGLKVNPILSMHPESCQAGDPSIEKLGVTEILILRHHDVTGKKCPLPLIGDINSKQQDNWMTFIRDIVRETS